MLLLLHSNIFESTYQVGFSINIVIVKPHCL